ncbi:AMP-binding protein [Azospirillum sp. sgz302134]
MPSSSRLFEMLEGAPDEAPAVVTPGRTVTYGALRRGSARLAAALKQRGLSRGDRLALWLTNVPEWLTVAMACSRLGVAVVPLNVRFGSHEVGSLLARTGCRAVVLAPGHRDGLCVEVLRAVPPEQRSSLSLVVTCGPDAPVLAPVLDGIAQASLDALLAENGTDGSAADGQPGDVCLILSTSGTTSAPKLVLHTQERNCRHVGDAAAAVGLLEPGTSLLLGIPMCGAFGYTLALTTLRAQRPIVLMESFVPEEAARLLIDHGVTHMLGTDDMLDKILAVVPEGKPFPALRMFGHANFTPALTGVLPGRAEAHGVLLRGFYGMTETLAMFAAQPPDAPLERRSQGGGLPVCAQAAVRVRDPESGALLPDGTTGAIELRAPNAMAGYLNDPAATAAAFTDDGWLRTGDLGLRLPDGGFLFIARMKDVLRIGGYLVSPTEIEDVILATPGVVTCQVVAASCSAGTRPVAFVVLEDGRTLDEPAMLAACRARLAVYKVPVRVFALDAMPVTDGPNGAKVKKNVLRDMADERLNAADALSPARA